MRPAGVGWASRTRRMERVLPRGGESVEVVELEERDLTCHHPEIVEEAELEPTCHRPQIVEEVELEPTCHAA
jgi:hypothetical protein